MKKKLAKSQVDDALKEMSDFEAVILELKTHKII
jgi:hypothetical protein